MKVGGEKAGKLESSDSFAESSESDWESDSGMAEESIETGKRCRRRDIASINSAGWGGLYAGSPCATSRQVAVKLLRW